jgi:hypothetical protein
MMDVVYARRGFKREPVTHGTEGNRLVKEEPLHDPLSI